MTAGHYQIDVDAPRKLLRLKLIGFWTAEIADQFAREQQAAARRIAQRAGEHLVLADLSEFNLQSQVVVGICRDLISKGPITSKRLAVVAGDGLARIQIKRILVRDRMEAFSDAAEAEAWLLRPDDELPARHAG